MSDTATPGAEAPAAPPVAGAAPPGAPPPPSPPETAAPQPEPRSPFVVMKPLLRGAEVIARGSIVSATAKQAAEHAALIRPATALDVSRWGRAVPEL